jgi:hypothetical protein
MLEDRTAPAVFSAGSDFAINGAANGNSAASLGVFAPQAAASTTTAATSATAAFNGSDQNVTLNATVTSDTGTVNEGTVMFTILQGTTVIGTAVSGPVSSGAASATYVLPGGTAAGTYTIEADYSDSAGNFDTSSDNTQTLTVNAAATTTTANSATATFNGSDQNVTLNASVTSDTGTVNEGMVTFTVLQGTTVIGTAVSGPVSSGAASATYVLPGGTATGTYTIQADYSDSAGNFDTSSDNTQTLTVGTATTTTANSVTATFSTSDQEGTFSATVTEAGTTTPVTEGSVTFTIVDSLGNTIGAQSATVNSSGVASINVLLPGGTPAGIYTIMASYSDSTGNFATSSDNTHTFTVNAASTTTTASNVTTSFSQSGQSVTLTATVTSDAGAVNEGNVTFTLVDAQGNTIGTATTSGTVSNGQASVSYTLPSGTATGNYTITAAYSDSAGDFTASSGQGTLAVSTAGTSLTLTTVNIVPNLLNGKAQVTLTVQVSTPAGSIGEGVVSVTLAGVSGQGNVVNGTASVQLTVPILDAIGSPSISLAYTDDPPTPASFANGNASTTLYFNIWNALLPTTLTFAADASQQTQAQLAGQSLLGFVFSPSGLLSEINVGSFSLPVTYNNVSGGVLVTIAGVPWQMNFVDANGQHQAIATLAVSADGTPEWLFVNSSGQVVGQSPL